jgi:hypothetical protein
VHWIKSTNDKEGIYKEGQYALTELGGNFIQANQNFNLNINTITVHIF